MSETRDAYDMLVNLGANEADSRQFLKDQTGVDPIRMTSATLHLTIVVSVELDEDELVDLSEDDVDEMAFIAADKVDVSGYDVEWDSTIDSELVEFDKD